MLKKNILILFCIALFALFCQAQDYNVSINNGDETTTSLQVQLNLSATDAVQMLFSCNNSDWTGYLPYNTFYNWDFASGQYGCYSHGEGTYHLYVYFQDSLLALHDANATIQAIGEPTVREPYTNPDDPKTTQVSWDSTTILLIILAAVVIILLMMRARRPQ